MSRLYRNANVYIDGSFKKMDFIIDDEGYIRENNIAYDEEYDYEGYTVIPGLIDTHVHLREPGYEYKETIKTGTMAAARGGFTTIFAMPNLKPAADSLEHLHLEQKIIDTDAAIKVIPISAITKGQKGIGELVDFKEISKEYMVFSDDGKGVQHGEDMKKAMTEIAKFDGLITAHCEDESELHGGSLNFGPVSEKYHDAGINNASEYKEVIRDLELSKETGCRFHICHMSTLESVEALRLARKTSDIVSGEVTAHHLLLNEDDINENHGRFKMNPPLRSKKDQEALIEGIKDGTIEVICSDNAPHSEAEKNCEVAKASFGIVENEASFALLYTECVRKGIISLEELIKLMSTNPARIFGIEGGTIELNRKCDLAVFDLDSEYTVDSEKFISMGKCTPFDGRKVNGVLIETIVDGKTVYRK